jgi:CheY-like chemotaxis protein
VKQASGVRVFNSNGWTNARPAFLLLLSASIRSGRAALAALQRETDIEAVLTDIRMPGMSGLELADYVRALNRRIAIVLMTGFSEALEQGQRVELPVLMKPFTSADMQEVLAASWASARSASG